jgi:hypothetical protein
MGQILILWACKLGEYGTQQALLSLLLLGPVSQHAFDPLAGVQTDMAGYLVFLFVTPDAEEAPAVPERRQED